MYHGYYAATKTANHRQLTSREGYPTISWQSKSGRIHHPTRNLSLTQVNIRLASSRQAAAKRQGQRSMSSQSLLCKALPGLDQLAGLTSLQLNTAGLSSTRINQELLHRLHLMPALQRLVMSDRFVADGSVVAMLAALTQLRHLELPGVILDRTLCGAQQPQLCGLFEFLPGEACSNSLHQHSVHAPC